MNHVLVARSAPSPAVACSLACHSEHTRNLLLPTLDSKRSSEPVPTRNQLKESEHNINHVLIVDEEADILASLSSILADEGYLVTTAAEILELIRSHLL